MDRTASAVTPSLEGEILELRRDHARLARTLRRWQWGVSLAAAAVLGLGVVAPGGFKALSAQQPPPPAGMEAPGVHEGPPPLIKIGRFNMNITVIKYFYRTQEGRVVVYFCDNSAPVTLDAREAAVLEGMVAIPGAPPVMPAPYPTVPPGAVPPSTAPPPGDAPATAPPPPGGAPVSPGQ